MQVVRICGRTAYARLLDNIFLRDPACLRFSTHQVLVLYGTRYCREGWFQVVLIAPSSFSVRCPRHFLEIFAAVLEMHLLIRYRIRRGGLSFAIYWVYIILQSRYIYLWYLWYTRCILFWGYLGLDGSHISGENRKRLTVRQGHIKRKCTTSGSISQKRRGRLDFRPEDVQNFRLHFVNTWFQV